MLTNSPHLTRRAGFALLALALPILAACEGQAAEEDLGLETEPGLETPGLETRTEGMEEGATMAGFSAWDLDNDTNLTESEFETGWTNENQWGEWDTDGDSYLTEDEFNTAFSNEGWYDESLYGEWDADNDQLLAEDEFTTGLFDTWDANDDQQLAENEFDTGLFD